MVWGNVGMEMEKGKGSGHTKARGPELGRQGGPDQGAWTTARDSGAPGPSEVDPAFCRGRWIRMGSDLQSQGFKEAIAAAKRMEEVRL